MSSDTRRYHLITLTIAVVSLAPILFTLSDMWDGDYSYLHQLVGSTSIYRDLLGEGWILTYYMRLGLHELSQLLNISHKLLTNIMTVVALLGISREAFKYIRSQFGVSKNAAYIGIWAIIAFPTWHVMLSSVNGFYPVYLWLFMLAVNLRYTNPLLALIPFIVSLQCFSIYPLAVGFACVDFTMTANRNDYKPKLLKVIAFSAVLLLAFLTFTAIVDIHGKSGSYNTIGLERLNTVLIFCIIALTALFSIHAILKRVFTDFDSERYYRVAFSVFLLILFSGLAYWAVGRPLRYFKFGSFTPRHTILTCIPFGVLVALVSDSCFKLFNARKVLTGALSFVAALVIILYQGYDHKVAALLFKDMLTHSFKQQPPPPSGYVGIFVEGTKPPQHVHNYSINLCMFKAYGKEAWMANGFWLRHIVPTKAALEEIYANVDTTQKPHPAYAVTGKAYTAYTYKLDNYHQEGRIWYWYNYFTKNYDTFNPQLLKRI